MFCPKCNTENNDSAKFCKKCGTPLTKNTVIQEKKSNNSKILIIALIIVCLVVAGSLIYFYGFNHTQSDEVVNNSSVVESVPVETEEVQTQEVESQSSSTTPQTSMSILGGDFSTGSKISDKTYASINVGSQHSGEKVKIQIKYYRNGNMLNNGNKVSKTVDSQGYIHVKSANSFKYYPDFAEINIFDTAGNLLAAQSVTLSPSSGTQSF